ncbi:GNAT family N-acetyltransferase [Actinoplanes sp. NPDC051851]|uniref:GNAT family N-acetyltransferase n=1 Tax=Actinoplanes sp. NPDC051851 TaxID=3154753 RepID=UPI0034391854
MPPTDVDVRDLEGPAEWNGAVRLYREVFGYRDPTWGINPRLLAALRDNAGTAIGAFRGGELIGFCYGFTAVDAGGIYHYSQAAAVAPAAQGSGVGRLLKHAQAERARATGARSLRWVFDPYALRNAHFNLTTLGAHGLRFLPDYYGEPGTDRVLISWDLAGGAPHRPGPSVVVAAGETYAAERPAERSWLRRELLERFAEGGRLVAVTRSPDLPGSVTYRFGRCEADARRM